MHVRLQTNAAVYRAEQRAELPVEVRNRSKLSIIQSAPVLRQLKVGRRTGQRRASWPAPRHGRLLVAAASLPGSDHRRQWIHNVVAAGLRSATAVLAAATVAGCGCTPDAAALTRPLYDDLSRLHYGRSHTPGSALPTSREAETIAELDKVSLTLSPPEGSETRLGLCGACR